MKTIICRQCGAKAQGTARKQFCDETCRIAFHNEKAKMARKAADPLDFSEGLPKNSGRHARNKGARVEREVCKVIEKVTGDEVSRILGQARDGGFDVEWGPFGMEVKARETLSIPAWQRQVVAAVGDTGLVPSIVWRRSGEKFWIALPFEAFLEIFQMLRKAAELGVELNGGQRRPEETKG